jgi:hypothetical protein
MKLIHKKFSNLVLYKPNYKKLNNSEIDYKDINKLLLKLEKNKYLNETYENNKIKLKIPKNIGKSELLERRFKYNILLNRYKLDLKEFHKENKRGKSEEIKKKNNLNLQKLNKTVFNNSYRNLKRSLKISMSSTMKSDINLNTSFIHENNKSFKLSNRSTQFSTFRNKLIEKSDIEKIINYRNLNHNINNYFKESDIFDYKTLIDNLKYKYNFEKEEKIFELDKMFNLSNKNILIKKKNLTKQKISLIKKKNECLNNTFIDYNKKDILVRYNIIFKNK